jgi:hypothetical protein
MLLCSLDDNSVRLLELPSYVYHIPYVFSHFSFVALRVCVRRLLSCNFLEIFLENTVSQSGVSCFRWMRFEHYRLPPVVLLYLVIVAETLKCGNGHPKNPTDLNFSSEILRCSFVEPWSPPKSRNANL